MKRTIITFAAVLAILGFAILTMLPKAPAASGAVAMAAPVPAALMAPMPMNHCPNIQHAIDAIQSAMNSMSKANHDYCGHKEEAIAAANHAVEQLRLAEDCDRCR